jgi:hypothetical protein
MIVRKKPFGSKESPKDDAPPLASTANGYRDIGQLLLEAYRTMGPGLSSKFMLMDAHGLSLPIGVELFRDPTLLRRASLILVQIEQSLFENEPVATVVSLLEKFFNASTYLIGNNELFLAMHLNVSVAEIATPGAAERLAQALSTYVHRERALQLHLAPVNRIAPAKDIISPNLIVVRGHPRLETVLKSLPVDLPSIRGDRSPPFEFSGRINMIGSTDCWLGCLASSENAALSKLRRMKGSLSLALPPKESMLFSGDLPLRGKITIRSDGEMTFNPSPLFPTLLNPQTLCNSMLTDLQDLIGDGILTGDLRRRVNVALEFIATSWISPPRTRFFNNAIAFDALFGMKGQVGKSIIAGVTKHAAAIPKVSKRIALLLTMRNAMLHGEVATIEEMPQYRIYYEEFDVDPISDQQAILRVCCFSLLGRPPAVN